MEKKLKKGTAINFCQTCNKDTIHVLHGYTKEGKLWKGHVCLCHNWYCSVCEKLSVGKESSEHCR